MGVHEEYGATVRNCPRCKTKQYSMHFCPEERDVIDPVAYREVKRNTDNPLDKLTIGDYLQILQGEEEFKRESDRRNIEFNTSQIVYFHEPLSYRVELEPLSSVPGFRPQISGVAIQVEGHDEEDWAEALSFLNEENLFTFRATMKEEIHQARLVSYGGEDGKTKYLWGVKRLSFVEGTGWVFSEWTN